MPTSFHFPAAVFTGSSPAACLDLVVSSCSLCMLALLSYHAPSATPLCCRLELESIEKDFSELSCLLQGEVQDKINTALYTKTPICSFVISLHVCRCSSCMKHWFTVGPVPTSLSGYFKYLLSKNAKGQVASPTSQCHLVAQGPQHGPLCLFMSLCQLVREQEL